MDFREFFVKKKIDPDLLQEAEPALFLEFRSEYEQMGEKSFDHTKKFWFNKLRRAYHTKEELKPSKATVIITDPIATQAMPLESPTIEQKPAFKPRFRVGAGSAKAEESILQAGETPVTEPPIIQEEVTEVSLEPIVAPAPKPGFTPRFKAGATKPLEPVPPAGQAASPGSAPGPPETSAPGEKAAAGGPPKPGFTPKFKPGAVKPSTPAETDAAAYNTGSPETPSAPGEPVIAQTPLPAATAKPGFTPRFRAGVTKSAGQTEEVPATGEAETHTPPLTTGTPEGAEDVAPPVTSPPKPGFKPRFNAAAIKKQQADMPPSQEVLPVVSNQDAGSTPPAEPPAETRESPESAAKPAYKPKFSAKAIKPADPEKGHEK
ncbi:hypothetical protein [Hufsiella ginkgonis]|uniref:Uncharacterized protein n=1 Tax=Hufsiella ginkgonis TaxID=2695274 RepID=A0A7K1XTM5_9SPHI|nr:hypothetical protein [Hufsiella ginkgonis]MXV13866.1 hypothetical protein [Hufsiella ginkgonis]